MMFAFLRGNQEGGAQPIARCKISWRRSFVMRRDLAITDLKVDSRL